MLPRVVSLLPPKTNMRSTWLSMMVLYSSQLLAVWVCNSAGCWMPLPIPVALLSRMMLRSMKYSLAPSAATMAARP